MIKGYGIHLNTTKKIGFGLSCNTFKLYSGKLNFVFVMLYKEVFQKC
jgi:hypothetical protein